MNGGTSRTEWVNWSGSLRFSPAEIVAPRDEEELARLVRRAREDGRVVRVAGAGHSSSPLVETGETLVSLEHLRGLEWHDRESHQATIRAGMTLQEAGEVLFATGLVLHNLGDINVQTVVGAVSTGTHGSGKRLQNLATALVGGRMVTAGGEIQEIPRDRMAAFRCALGGLGIFTAIRLRLLPAFQLRRRELCTTVERLLANIDDLAESNRNFDFYWYPRSDEVKVRTMNPPSAREYQIAGARLVEDRTGWAHQIISKKRELKFEEMEYALPAEAGIPCFQEIRRRVLDRHRRTVAWRVLYRLIAPDDAFLSTAHGRQTVTISLHHNAGLPFAGYFDDIEPIFRSFGGRPHWGKKHSLRARELRPLYPQWDEYQRLRRELDPDGVFLNRYLRSLFGEENS